MDGFDFIPELRPKMATILLVMLHCHHLIKESSIHDFTKDLGTPRGLIKTLIGQYKHHTYTLDQHFLLFYKGNEHYPTKI